MENSSQVPNRVFVGGISWKTSEKQLADFFSFYGKVVECKIIIDKVTQKSKGYGFVTFENVEDANKVKRLNSVDFQGKSVNVGDAVRKSDTNKQGNQNFSQGYPSQFYYDQYGYPPSSPYYGSYVYPYMYPYDQSFISPWSMYPYQTGPYSNDYYTSFPEQANGNEDSSFQGENETSNETNSPPNTDNSSSSNSNQPSSNNHTSDEN